MEEKIAALRAELEADLAAVHNKDELSAFWQKYLSKNGSVTGLTKSLRDVPKEERPAAGKTINEFKVWVEGQYQAASAEIEKAERFATHESLPTHAMTIAGVDIKDGKPTKWKIENSWGTENHGMKTGNNGYFVCSDEWFDNFVYEVAIRKDRLSPEMQKALDSDPIVWPFWNTFNPVSA